MSAKDNPPISKACSFCNSREDNEVEYGKILEHNGIVTHYYCLLLSSNMEQKGTDDEGILGFLAEDIQKELRRGRRLVCSHCRKSGATLGCCNVKCKRIFHLPCGLKAGSLHQFFGEFRSYCVNHRPKQKVDDQILKQIHSVDSVLCYICYDKVNTNDFVKTLWAPCCKKDAWFHRNCVQQLALSAGYFFKCPLCNNKKDFQKAMLEYGIFVPSQDASWELVPNAFEELLYRHDQCDASNCLCPKGRKHTSSNAKWELTLCRICGSQGIHMACGQLKWANPVWECNECSSILRNSEQHEPVRLGNSSTIDNSSLDRKTNPDLNSNSESESNPDLNSDLDSDTDISVGTDFPMPVTRSSSPISSLDSILDVRLRPGPRSFKLQQQMIELDKCRLDLTNTNLERNVTTEACPKESSSNNDNEKEEPSTSRENISQKESKKNSSEKERQSSSKNDERQSSSKNDERQSSSKNDERQSSSKNDERQSSSKNDETSQSFRKETNVITIESDDESDVELITFKQKPNFSPQLRLQLTQSSSSQVYDVSTLKQTTKSPLNAIQNSATSKSQNITTIDLSNDNIDVPNPTVSESEASSKNESNISDQIATICCTATPQKSTLNLVASNSNVDSKSTQTDAPDTNEISVMTDDECSSMNIKITSVTSLSPEVFESVPDVHNNVTLHDTTDNTSSLSASEVLTQLVTHVSTSIKRSMYEVTGVTDNCKKIKRNSFDESLRETSSTVISAIVAQNTNNTDNINNINNTNKQQNENTKQQNKNTGSKSSENGKNDKDPSKCVSETTNYISNPLSNNQNNNLLMQSIPFRKADDVQHTELLTNLKKNNVTITLQSKENSVAHRNTEFVTFSEGNPIFLQALPPINSFYLEQIPNPNFTISPNAVRTDKTNMYTIPTSNIILPSLTDSITVLGNQAMLVNQPMVASVTPILNNNQIATVSQKKEATSRRLVPASISDAGNNSSNKSYCDGDAGTRPAEADSASHGNKKDNLSRDFHRSVSKQDIAPQTRSVFPQVTNNQNTCHQPRLIPRYMNLQDLKFQVSESNNVQMILYDTFSVNIPIKNSKESKSRSAGVAASRKSKESSILASREASSSSDCINNIPTERQRSDKFFRSLKNENCSINDKSICAKYVVHSQDDAKENLDPIRSRMLSHSSTLGNVSPTNDVDDTDTMSDCFYDENDSETRLVSSDTNLSVLNKKTIYNTNIDNVTDGVTLVASSCNQLCSRVDLESVQHHKVFARSAVPASAEERLGARLCCKETNRIVHNVDFDLNVVNMNKNVEKVLQDDVTTPMSQHTDGNKIDNDTDDSPVSWNGYRSLDSKYVMKPKASNRNIVRVSNITRFNEHNILNKQINTCDSKKFIRCMAFQENTIRRNSETRAKNSEFCLKVSVDLCKIQNLIDSKPELFENREHDANDQRYKNTSWLGDYAQQQVRYCDIESSDSINNCLPKSRELRKSNYTCNVEHVQRDFPAANTFLRYQKSIQGRNRIRR